jgi:hypothetical protein
MSCRICFENDQNELLSKVCKCKGSMKYIHKSCFLKSISFNGNTCKTCNTEFDLNNIFLKIALYKSIKIYIYFTFCFWLFDLFLSKYHINWYNTGYVLYNDPFVKKWENFNLIDIKLLTKKFSLKSIILSMVYYLLETIQIQSLMNINYRIIICIIEYYLILFNANKIYRNRLFLNILLNELYCFSKIFIMYFYNEYVI